MMKGIIAVILLFLTCAAPAQDVVTVEMMIRDHKNIRSLLLTRSVIEELNGVLHEASSITSHHYKEIGDSLDNYTRCFNVIDDIVNAGATAFHIRNAYQTVKERVDSYVDLLDRYKTVCVERGDFLSSDSIIITISRDAISDVANEVESLLRTFTFMIGYVSGEMPCTHLTMMTNLQSVNDSLDRIVNKVNNAYIRLWRYVMLRTGYHRKSVIRGKTVKQMADEAFDRWMRTAHDIDY